MWKPNTRNMQVVPRFKLIFWRKENLNHLMNARDIARNRFAYIYMHTSGLENGIKVIDIMEPIKY